MYLHYDMDCFFASIEMRDNPKLRTVPLAVGNHVVATSNYIARKYGVHSAMPINIAKKMCPNLVVVDSRVEYYIQVANCMQKKIKEKFGSAVFLSCDEGYIQFFDKDIEGFCKRFKEYIYNNFKLSVSVGVGFNRIVSKIASECNKPNGIFILNTKDKFIDYIYDKSISIFPGIGSKTFEIFYQSRIIYTKDIYEKSKEQLQKLVGKARGSQIFDMVRGNDDSIYDICNIESSISKESTYYPFLSTEHEKQKELKILCNEIKEEIRKKKEYPLCITLKVRNQDYETFTKSKTFNSPITENSDILLITREMLRTLEIYRIRLLGISISNFSSVKYEYLKLFGD